MLAALLTPGAVLLTVQTTTARVPRPAGMSRSAAYTLMASPVTFTAFARLTLLIAGPGTVTPGTVTPGSGSSGWRAFSLVILWASAALAAAILAQRTVPRATLPIFLSIQLLSWMLAGIAVTGTAALNGVLLFKLLRFLALGALLLAGSRKSAQPILNASWWLAARALGALPFSAGFSSAWLVTSGAVGAGPAWLAGIGINWLALLLVTLAIIHVGGTEQTPAEAPQSGSIRKAELLPSFLLFLLAGLPLVLGIAPEVVVTFFTGPAASALPVIASQAPGAGVQANQLGLLTATGTWLPEVFWLLTLVLLLLAFFLTRQTHQPAAVPPFLGVEAEAERGDDPISTSPPHAEEMGEPEGSLQG